ncbi:pyridoxamine 5'-phosphate oxidase family protein [Amycolatopsis sp.]|uniref:pyridoxamine 5'-phosphate oxidase family protein n=1 Tax=Amycolatopsis sp. TaxID=37632 RepID=UPI002B858F01|nr:pyridoxamine 5'-phosphate oxidase family protein [Amycolatopsis sp.]HVV09275.1 pyridoxamine 5'-phosphate oxidase family protein [Amycolatopsis sp.]
MGADRRAEIKMTLDEQRDFLRPTGKMALSTIGPDGYIHTTALYYAFLGDEVAFLAKRKSQKVVNVRRDPRVTVMREEGEKYYDLRGLTLIGDGEVRDDHEALWTVGEYLYRTRHGGTDDSPEDVERIVERSIHNRAVIVVHPKRIISWDHRKLRAAQPAGKA